MLIKSASDFPIEPGVGGVNGAQPQDERLQGNDGAFDQSRIIAQRHALFDQGQTFFNHLATPGVVRVVKAAQRFLARIFELLKGRPFLQQRAGHRSGEILSAEFQRLGKVSFQQGLKLIAEPGAHVHAAAPGLG